MAKLVTIKVFEYDELPKPLRENIFERVRDGIIDDNFEAFPEIAWNRRKSYLFFILLPRRWTSFPYRPFNDRYNNRNG